MEVVKLFATRVREERLRRGLSQERLADVAGLHRTYISGLERAEINATLRTAERVAHALNLDLVDLLSVSDTPRNDSGERVGEAQGRYKGAPTGSAAEMRLRITLETDERGALQGSGRARFGDKVFPFRVDDVRAIAESLEGEPPEDRNDPISNSPE